ncbi:MAG: translation initiation factor IF-3 [Planctomycetota bacterium]
MIVESHLWRRRETGSVNFLLETLDLWGYLGYTRLVLLISPNQRNLLTVRFLSCQLRKGKRAKGNYIQTPINEGIRALSLRVIHEEKGNLGVMSKQDAITLAKADGFDLIEISPDANPPVAKITDWGQFQYELKKKQKEARARTKPREVKSIQIKTGTGENDVRVKAKRSSEWLGEDHRVKVELYLRGRAKYMDKSFLKERLTRFLSMLTIPYVVVEEFKQTPKGFALTVERDKSAKTPENIKPEMTEPVEQSDEDSNKQSSE